MTEYWKDAQLIFTAVQDDLVNYFVLVRKNKCRGKKQFYFDKKAPMLKYRLLSSIATGAFFVQTADV